MSEQIERPDWLEALHPGDELGAVVADLVAQHTPTGYESFNDVFAWVGVKLNKARGKTRLRPSSDLVAFVDQEVRVAWNDLALQQGAAWPTVMCHGQSRMPRLVSSTVRASPLANSA